MFDFRYIIIYRNQTIQIGEKMFFGKRFSGHQSGSLSGLDILVLSIIENFDGISGYALIRKINEKFKNLWRVSPGTIYPLLNRLTAKGFINIEAIIRNNRQLKLYRITESGKKGLKEILKNNLESSINTLGEYIRTIVKTWIPDEERIHGIMSCFPYHYEPSSRNIDKDDYSLANIERVNKVIKELDLSKHRLSRRLKEIDKTISEYKVLLNNLKKKREENVKIIEILDDDDDFENF